MQPFQPGVRKKCNLSPPPRGAHFLAIAAVMTPLLAAASARADVITTSIAQGSLPPSSATLTPLDISGLAHASTGTFTLSDGTQLNLATPGGQGIVTGTSVGNYANPVAGGTTASPVLWAGNFLSTGVGAITFTFTGAEKYFGLLWGSVDNYNSFELLNHGNVVSTITGSNITSAANGNQGYAGSYYVLLNDLSGTFDQVRFLSSANSFESADFQVSAQNVSVPEPASAAAFGGALAMLGALVIRRRSGHARYLG